MSVHVLLQFFQKVLIQYKHGDYFIYEEAQRNMILIGRLQVVGKISDSVIVIPMFVKELFYSFVLGLYTRVYIFLLIPYLSPRLKFLFNTIQIFG